VSQATQSQTGSQAPATACGDVPELARLRYFHGRALGALDLRREQSYHLEKARLRNRLLHGWGIVCGLDVEVVEKQPCDPADDDPKATALVVGPGAAIDCHGNEIVVRNPREVALAKLLSAEALRNADSPRPRVYLTLCYHEQPIDPTRPLLAAECEPVPACEYGRISETFRICASTERPDPGPACEPCCGSCGHACIVLATIEEYNPDEPVVASQLRFDLRRAVARHDLARIAGVNWVHGATYTREAATRLLAGSGLKIRFSRPVQVASLRPHVIELTTIEGGGGRSGAVYALGGAFDDPPAPRSVQAAGGELAELPDQRVRDLVVYRSTSDETLQFGDRVLITIRGDFILDECCRAVDGAHVGGAVAKLALDDDTPSPSSVPVGPPCPPRASGSGTEGGDFVSWILVQERSDR